MLLENDWTKLLNSYFLFDVVRAGDQPVLYYLKYRALLICRMYTHYTWYLLASDNLQIKDGRVKGNDWYRTDMCSICDKAVLDINLIIILYLIIMFNIGCTYSRTFVYALTLKRRGRAKWPTANLNDYFSATECPIDLKPSCIFKFVRCLEVYEKIDLFGPWRDPGGPLIGKGPPISASQGQF